MLLQRCANGTYENCTKWENVDLIKEDALEEVVWNGLKMWHIIFLSILAVLSLVILLCCCVKFRIPRTKQEIEADYIRRKILRKFRKRLKAIQNQELDEMDLKKALDKIRAEFKSDTESLAQSEAGFSAATISSTGAGPGATSHGATYRRASQIQIDISLEDLRAHSMGMKARVALAFARLCGRSKTSKSDKVALTVDAEGEAQISVPEGAFKTKKPSDKNKDKNKDPPPPAKSPAPTPKAVKGKTPPAAAATPTPKTLAPPKETTQKVKKGKKGAQPPPPTEAAHTSMEVKGQQGTTAEQTQGKASSGPVPDKKVKETKKEKEDKKQKEKEKEERKQREKEEKQKQKEEKTKLKIENEKAQKAQKEKEKQEKLDKKKEKGAKPGDKVDKDKK